MPKARSSSCSGKAEKIKKDVIPPITVRMRDLKILDPALKPEKKG